jgi:hypothetical protein
MSLDGAVGGAYPRGVEFPMSLKLEERERVFTTSGTYLGGVDLAPLLVEVAAPVTVVFNVAYSIVDDDGVPAGAGGMAADIGIQTDVHKIVGGQELLVMATADLPAFFDGWRQFGGSDVDALDLPAPPTAEDMDAAVGAVERPAKKGRRFLTRRQQRQLERPVLSSLATPTFYYHGHDDIYFVLESRTDRLARLVLRRLLALKAGSARRRQRVTVPDPGDHVAASLLDESHGWTGEISESTPESVSIALAPVTWRLGQRLPRKPAYYAVFDIPSKEWELRRFVP